MDLESLDTAGCVALATLNDAGTVAGCEGDVASAVAMLLVRALFDQARWMANPALRYCDLNVLERSRRRCSTL
jgi:L-fucose isomerase-like protein